MQNDTFTTVDYTTAEGKPSRAYVKIGTREAYDTFTRMPVNVVNVGNGWREYAEPEKQAKPVTESVPEQKQEQAPQRKKRIQPQHIVLVPLIAWWQVPAVAVFGLLMMWLLSQFPSALGY